MRFNSMYIRPEDIQSEPFVDVDGEHWPAVPERFGHDLTSFMLVNTEDYEDDTLEPVLRLCKGFLGTCPADEVKRGIGAFMSMHGKDEVSRDLVLEVLTRNLGFLTSPNQRNFVKPLAFLTTALHVYLETK